MTDYTDLLEWLDSKGKLSDYNCYKDASEAIRQLIAERDHYKEECLEQARLLGISGERELKLIAGREDGKWAAELKAENEQLSLYKSLADEYGLSVFADLAELQKQRDELLAALEGLTGDIQGLIGESYGVSGLHQNGDVAPWEELESEGRFERLTHLPIAHTAIASVKGGAK